MECWPQQYLQAHSFSYWSYNLQFLQIISRSHKKFLYLHHFIHYSFDLVVYKIDIIFLYTAPHIDLLLALALAIKTTIYDFSFWFYFTGGTVWTVRKRAAYARVNVWVGAKGKEEEGDSHPKCIMQEEAIVLLLQYKNISTIKEGWRWHFLSVQQPTTSNSITRLTIK